MEKDIFTLPCLKIQNVKSDQSFDKAMIYLNLIDSDCPKRKAVKFCKKNRCKSDVTTTITGPRNYRILKPKINDIYQNNILNGWLINLNLDYDMGKKYIVNKNKDVLKTDAIDQKINEDLDKQKKDIQQSSSQKIETYYDQYLTEVNKKYNFASLKRQQLVQKLMELQLFNCININQSKECYKLKNLQDLNLFEIVEFQKQQKNSFQHPLGEYPKIFSEKQVQNLTKTNFIKEDDDIDQATYFNEEYTLNIKQPILSKQNKLLAQQEQFNQQQYIIKLQNDSTLKQKPKNYQTLSQLESFRKKHTNKSSLKQFRALDLIQSIKNNNQIQSKSLQVSPEKEFENAVKIFVNNQIDTIQQKIKSNHLSIDDQNLKKLQQMTLNLKQKSDIQYKDDINLNKLRQITFNSYNKQNEQYMQLNSPSNNSSKLTNFKTNSQSVKNSNNVSYQSSFFKK